MKGECDGRELTHGAPVSVGAGGISGHSREGSTGRIEAGVKGEHQDSVTRSLQVPAVVGGAAQGNGTRGFTVAELTRVDDVTTDKGNLQIPSVKSGAIGSIRVPSFMGEGQGRAPGREDEAGVQEGDEDRATGSIKIPTINKEGLDLSCGASVKRVSHDTTSGSSQVPGVKGEDQGSGTWTLNVTKGESQSATTGVTVTDSGVDNTKKENQTSAAEIPGLAATKRVNQDCVTLEMPSEATIKRLKKEDAPGMPDGTDGKKASENNATDLQNTAAVKRVSQDGATGLPGVTDVKRIRQDNLTETASVTTVARENQNSVTDTVNSTQVKTPSESALAMASAAHVKKINQSIGTEDLQVETIKGGKQNGATSLAVKGCPKGNAIESLVSALMQKKESRAKESLKILCVEPGSLVHPKGSPPVPAMKKEIDETPVREKESSWVLGIKHENQGKGEGQDKGTHTEKLAVPQQCSEEKSERKQENLMKDDDKNMSKVGQGEADEGKMKVCGSSSSLPTKPEMVSIETQCDDSSMLPDKLVKDEYAFLSEDAGVPGECLGGCEPGKKPHKCCQCDTSFRTPYELSRHGRVHTGERPYQCRLCHRCFKRKDHVEVHTRRHVEDRRYACKECGVCFVTSSCLLRHQRRTHQAPGTKRPGEGENEEGDGEAGDIKGDGKDQPASKDTQKNGRRNKKNKPDSTYRPGGKTVCIIKKRNLRQRSYSFVELEDDVECFESDEEDRIPFLKVQEQRREEEHEESGSQSSQLDHSLFPASLFNPEASLGQLLLLGEVSRMLSHSLLPGPLEGPGIPASLAAQVGRTFGPAQDADWDSDDSDCDPPLVACDVTFMETEEEVAGISLPDNDPAAPQPEVVMPQAKQDKAVCKKGALKAATKTGPKQTTHQGRPCHRAPVAKEVHGCTMPPAKCGTATTPQPGCKPHFTSCRSAQPPGTNNKDKVGGTGVGAMGEPRTAWVVPENNTKGKNTCDACRKRNEANRQAQLEQERQTITAQAALKQKGGNKPRDTPKRCQPIGAAKTTAKPAMVTPPSKPRKPKPAANKRGRKPGSAKKRQSGKAGAEGNRAAAAPQRPYKCHLCPFNFRSATELKRHASTHSGERPFLCELCGAGFMRKCHLQLHVRRHSGERRHACQECRMRFFTPSDLARHQAIHQVPDKPLECQMCHLTFRRAFHLERHLRRHNEAAPYACKLCGAFFSSAAALRSHDKHHRTPGPHACPDCTAAFTTATALSRHRRVHSARHHRLLRAIERHATAKSSYECVSSEGSPLSLVIRKVSAAAGTQGEVGANPLPDESPSLADKDKEETERDKITSGLSTTDKETEGKVEGRETDISNLPKSKETEESENIASNLSNGNNETKAKVEGSEEITSNPSAPDKTKEDRESITSSPSITDEIKDDREKITCSPSSAGREKEGSEANAWSSSITNKINEESEKVTSTPSDREEKERNEKMTTIPSMTQKVKGKVEGREKTIPTFSSKGKESGIKEEVNSSSHGENSATIQENSSVFGCTATLGQDSNGPIKLYASSNSKSGKDVLNHKEALVSPCINSGNETGNKSISSKTENVEESGSKTGSSTTKKEIRVVASEELNSKPILGLSPMSKERKEAQERSSCSLLLPSSREMGTVKEEMLCRTTYRLAASSGGQEEVVHGGSGYPRNQEGGRGSAEEGGQKGGAREGVTTTS